MRFLSFLALLVTLISCEKDDPTPGVLLGSWELAEVYVDSGDGSGTFRPADYHRRITFLEDSTYVTNVSICNFGDRDEPGGTGFYSAANQEIHPTTCRMNVQYPYAVDGLALTINYFCFEGCAERYRKVADE